MKFTSVLLSLFHYEEVKVIEIPFQVDKNRNREMYIKTKNYNLSIIDVQVTLANILHEMLQRHFLTKKFQNCENNQISIVLFT